MIAGSAVASTLSDDRAESLARDALAAMERFQIAPTPMNFTVWFAYHQGANRDLVAEIERYIARGEAFSQELCLKLYGKYFDTDKERDQVLVASHRIETAVGQVLSRLGEAGRDNEQHGERLASISGNLDEDQSQDVLRSLITTLSDEVRHMARRNTQLAEAIYSSTQEISDLRNHLQDVRKQGLTDGLTQVANRRAFDIRLGEAIQEAKALQNTFTLIMADVDHFKKFNDSYGHQMGDEVLKIVGKIMTHRLKEDDFVARYGGEEFSVILPDTKLVDGQAVAERLRSALAGKRLRNRRTGDDFGRVTLSLGVTHYVPGDTAQTVIERADKALYQAKREGRNRVACQQPSRETPQTFAA